jgi:hypothetical protein
MIGCYRSCLDSNLVHHLNIADNSQPTGVKLEDCLLPAADG